MGNPNRIQSIVIDDLKKGLYTKQSKIDKLAKEIGVNKYDLRGFLRKKLKPGLKIAGRRFFSNVDEIAGFLREKSKENQLRIQKSKALGPISKIIPFEDDPRGPKPKYPIRPISRLKYLAKGQEIPWKDIQGAIDAFKTTGGTEENVVRQLIKTLDDEYTNPDVLRKFIKDQTRRITDPVGLLKDYVKNKTDIRWRTIQNAMDMGKSPRKILEDLKGKTGKVGFNIHPSGEIDFTGEHKYAEDLQKEFKKANAEKRAREKLVKSTKNKITKFQRPDVATRANLQIRELAKLGKEAKSQNLWTWTKSTRHT